MVTEEGARLANGLAKGRLAPGSTLPMFAASGVATKCMMVVARG